MGDLLSTAQTVSELLASEDRRSESLSSQIPLLVHNAANTDQWRCWQALSLLWPQYTRTATNVVQRSGALPDSIWWSLHHAVHEMAQHCKRTEDVVLILSQMGLYAAQVSS